MTDSLLSVTMEMVGGYEFRVRFSEDLPELLMDESPPLGSGKGPAASRVLAAAIGNCLSASLLFCLRKARVEPKSLRADVTVAQVRNDRGRLRVGNGRVTITVDVGDKERGRLERCAGLFEEFCVVTASVRDGLKVDVNVKDSEGKLIYSSPDASP